MPISLTTAGSPYTQNFDGLSNTAASSTNDIGDVMSLAGWFLTEVGGGTRDNEQYGVDTGGSNTGDTYSYGAAGSTDRALGALQSGTLISTFGANFTNDTGNTITELTISYYGEQWRISNTGAARDDKLDFQISTNATSLTTGTWTDVNELDFTNIVKTAASAGALNGNDAANRVLITHTITGLNIAPGASFWIRWIDFNAAGADDGLAIDDFSIVANAASSVPTLNIDDVVMNEGDSGTTTFIFTVSLSAPAGPGGVTFDIATADNSATTADGDYIARSLTGQTIPQGETSYQFSVTVNGDKVREGNETFFVNVTNVTGATAGDAQGQGTIVDDDTPVLTIADVSQAEGNAGTGVFSFVVSLDRPAPVGGVTFDIATQDSSAEAGSDYVARSLTAVTIPEGETSYTFDVTVNGDTMIEPDETFLVNVSNVTGASVGDSQATGTIENDDSVNVSVAGGAIAEGNEGVSFLEFTITLSRPANGGETVDFITVDGSAAAGTDYVATAGTIVFAAGETVQTVRVPIIGDTRPEANESFTLALANPQGLVLDQASATGTITNDDGPLYFSLASGSFSQDWTDTGLITANDDWSGVPHIVGYLGDYTSASPTGVDARTLTAANTLGQVDVIANLTNTGSTSGGVGEFHLANPTIALQGSGTADAPSIVLFMDASGRQNIRFQANIRDIDGTTDDAVQQVAVQYRTDPNGAWSNVPNGYIADATTGPSVATLVTAIDVVLPADADNAATLQIRILTTNAAGNDEWVGIDDIVVSSELAPPSYSIADGAAYEGDAGTSAIVFTVTRAGDVGAAGTVDYAVSFPGGGFSASAADFASALSGTVVFDAGEASRTITLQIAGDTIPEADEAFLVTLSNPSTGTLGDAVARGTIVNDDGPPALVAIADVTQAEGDGGATVFTFTVTRTGGSGAFTIDYQTLGGTATEGVDYEGASGTLSFAEGEDSKTIEIIVNGDTLGELAETFTVQLSNPVGAVLAVEAATGTIQNDDILFIHQIQGSSYYSPILAGDGFSTFNVASVTTVVVRAVVTALDGDGQRQGFYLTEEYADWDSSVLTSEGIFVMTRNDAGTGSTLASAVPGLQVGDIVTVTAQVMEYQSFNTMPRTMLVNPSSVIINSTGNEVPTLLLDASRPIPNAILTGVTPDYTDSADDPNDTFDASLYALSFWETVEGMLVTVPDMVVADGFVQTSGGRPFFQAYSEVHANADQINSRGGYTIAGDPPHSPPDTATAADDTIRGGRHLHDGDTNPDIIELDFTGFAMAPPAGLLASLSMGDRLGDVTGIVDFDFTDRKLFVTHIDPGSFVDSLPTREVTSLGGDGRSLTVATFNVENLDPGDGQARFDALAEAIATNLNAPDIISIEEIQDNNGTVNNGVTDASTTWQMLVDALNARVPGANYQWVDREPVNNAEGGAGGGNIRVGFLYNTNRVQLGDLPADATIEERRQYTDRIGDGVRDANALIQFSDDMVGGINPADWTNTRLSLLGQFTFNGNTVFVTANHFTAKGGSGEFWQFNQDLEAGDPANSGWARRVNQAEDVWSVMNLIRTAAPEAGVVAGGDFNDFYFYRPLETLTGYVTADGSARIGGHRFDNLTLTLAEAERYTYTFDGRSQAIDHIVVDQRLAAVATYDIVHINTGFSNTGTGANANLALSDHDPAVASFDFRSFSELLRGTAGTDLLFGFGGDDTIYGEDGDDTLYGGVGDDILFGGDGNDRLFGQGGADITDGGFGDDVHIVDHVGDVVIERVGEGNDTILTQVDYALANGLSVEILSAQNQRGTANLNLRGNSFDQTIVGNFGNNVLNGGSGIDILWGLGGDDLYIVHDSRARVIERINEGFDTVVASVSFALEAGSHVEVLSTQGHAGTAAINLSGNEFSQTIYGNYGDNVLSSGTGAPDIMIGFFGDDTYIVHNAGDQVIERVGGGNDLVAVLVSYRLGADAEVEGLVAANFDGAEPLSLTGNGFAQIIVGNGGDNVLNGLGGGDVMAGREGDDRYYVHRSDDIVIELEGEGNDTILTHVSYALCDCQEIETLSTAFHRGTAAIDLIGNEYAQTILGNFGDNWIDGKGGSDTLRGFAGADTFAFTTELGTDNVDTILDFEVGVDTIALDQAIFDALAEGSLSNEAFRIGSAAQDADDRIIYDAATGALFYDADGNGAGAAVQFAVLQAGLSLSASDFEIFAAPPPPEVI